MRNAAARWLFLLGTLSPAAFVLAADGFAVRDIWFEKSDRGYAVRAEMAVRQEEPLDEILRGGYQVRLLFELVFVQRREWWLDKSVGDISWHGELSYDPLVNRYVLVTGETERRFSSLSRAVDKIEKLRAGAAADPEYIKLFSHGDIYVRARLRMLTTHLPQPIQIALLVNTDWDTSGDWVIFPLTVRSDSDGG